MEEIISVFEEDLQAHSRSYAQGEVICRQGEQADALYIFIRGEVDVFVDRYKVSVISTPYTPLGELSLLTKRPRTATVIAARETVVCLLDEETFNKHFQRLPVVFQKILENLANAFLGKESNLLAMMEELEERVLQRTEKLHQANRELAELNTFKNTMIGMAAHDLRNPLHVLNGYLGIILDTMREQIPAEPLGYLQICQSVARNTCDMLNSLLDVSMIDSGRIVLAPKRAELPTLLTNALKMTEIFARKKNITIHYSAPQQAYVSCVDTKRVAQVLENLLTNAIKYSPADTNIFVTCSENDTHNLIAIRDEGPGIPVEDQGKIFTPFFRTANKPTAGEHSTGLGLLIVKKIVDLHEGVLFVDSTPGEGSTFTVGFPKE